MSVKYALLALLDAGPATAYQLKKQFDQTTGHSWPLNVGQVSTTLQRLERDELIQSVQDHRLDGSDVWQLTSLGRTVLHDWWASPVLRTPQARDELVLKLSLASTTPGCDAVGVIQRQRVELQSALHDVTRAFRSADAQDVPARLVLQHHIYLTEAEIRWLDATEGLVLQAQREAETAASTAEQTADGEKPATRESAPSHSEDAS